MGGRTSRTPFTRTVIKGSRNSLTTDTPQSSGGQSWAFSSWSDGGALTHVITAPDSATTYTANFSAEAPPPSTGLVAALGFDELSGAAVSDASGRGNAGTIQGATRAIGGRYGGALSFDGVNDWVTVPDSASLDLTSGMTLEAWVRPVTVANWRTVLIKEQPGNLIYALYASNGPGQPNSYVFTNTDHGTTAPAPLPTNTWTHLAASDGGGALRFYVNGTQVATSPLTGTLRTSTGALRIGGNSIWAEWFNGLIDEVRIYNRPLTQTEIQTDMNTPIGP